MKNIFFTAQFKKILRTSLGPLLPFIRLLRTIPERVRSEKYASQLQTSKSVENICYLTSNFPQRPALRTELAGGGAVKLTFLAESFPHFYPTANFIYTVSSVDHINKYEILHRAKQNGLKIILNQNGVAYLAWHGPGWEEANNKLRTSYELADFIVFQSKFCQEASTIFLGKSSTPSQVIYNPVDINLYQPAAKTPGHRGPILLLGGNQFAQYRFDTAIQVLKKISAHLPDTRLIVTGKLWGDDQKSSMEASKRAIMELGLQEQVEFTGSYTQASAPLLFQRADILLHTQYNDASPTLVAEAMASGLPVVYSASGGVPELVTPEAGIGIPVEQSWDKICIPDIDLMARAVISVWENHNRYSMAARQQAEQEYSLDKFILAHRTLFANLMER